MTWKQDERAQPPAARRIGSPLSPTSIPIEMIRQALLRKQRQTATVSYTPNVARTSVRFTIPLHRIEIPLGPAATKK
jgi:hypothetical protein